jgi:hypothetical protein
LHVNRSEGISSVTLNVRLANRIAGENPAKPTPSWAIKVTQLECPGQELLVNTHWIDAINDFPLLGETERHSIKIT